MGRGYKQVMKSTEREPYYTNIHSIFKRMNPIKIANIGKPIGVYFKLMT